MMTAWCLLITVLQSSPSVRLSQTLARLYYWPDRSSLSVTPRLSAWHHTPHLLTGGSSHPNCWQNCTEWRNYTLWLSWLLTRQKNNHDCISVCLADWLLVPSDIDYQWIWLCRKLLGQTESDSSDSAEVEMKDERKCLQWSDGVVTLGVGSNVCCLNKAAGIWEKFKVSGE